MAIQSFKRNQSLIDHLNSLLVYYKLKKLGKADQQQVDMESIKASKELVKDFISKILSYSNNHQGKGILGVDSRLRIFVRRFEDAKTRKHQFKSLLFKDTPEKVIVLLDDENGSEDLKVIINALSELRTMVEAHNHVDLKELIEGF